MSCYSFLLNVFILYFCFVGWSSNNWVMMWIMMELMFTVFLGLSAMLMNYLVSEFMMKYFIIQVFVSLLMFMFFMLYFYNMFFDLSFLVFILIMIKLALFPFHMWLVELCGKLSWLCYFYMMTLMKFMPLLFLNYLTTFNYLGLCIVFIVLFGGVLGLNNVCLQKLFIYSSMIHFCWTLLCLFISMNIFWFYFFTYVFTMVIVCFLGWFSGCYYINQLKIMSNFSFISCFIWLFNILSLGGFPPFLGFVAKWMVYLFVGIGEFKLMMFVMIGFSLIPLYFYFQLFYYFLMIYSFSLKWVKLDLNIMINFFIMTFILLGGISIYFMM